MLVFPAPAFAVKQPPNRGLFISPLRQFVTTDPGQPKSGQLTVANITDKPISVTLSVGEFSVTDYTYDYQFNSVKEDWITLSNPQVELKPFQSKSITYNLAVPKGASPGGRYFTIFATTVLRNESVDSTVRVASVLFVTVDGKLKKTSEIRKGSLPAVSFGGNIDFSLDLVATGNTYFFVYANGKLNGLSTKPAQQEAAHILVPGAARTVKGVILAPLLPGVYQATYGYKTDSGTSESRSKYIIYAPVWFLAIMAIGLWYGVRLLILRHHRIRHRD